MKQLFNVVVISVLALAACTTPFKKTKDGTEYKVISNSKGAKMATGNFMEMNVLAKYKDSILYSTHDEGMPQFGVYDTSKFPPPYKEAFKILHVGDSVVLRIPTDSIIARGQAAPFMKKGQFIYQSYKITNQYLTKEQMDSAQKAYFPVAKVKMFKKQSAEIQKKLDENKEQLAKDSKLIDEYLAKNNIKSTKTNWGTYIVIHNEGTGEKITADDVASINYTGKTFDSSKVFDSNTDPKFNHVEPYNVSAGQLNGIIAGWPDALLQLKKGAKATIYIPSTLAYGKEGRMPEIKGDQILVFDMDILNVTSETEMMAKQEQEEKAMRESQQKIIDSMKNANPRLKTETK